MRDDWFFGWMLLAAAFGLSVGLIAVGVFGG